MTLFLCFGEIMMRLTPPGYERFLQAEQYQRTFGGSEINVAVSLSILGAPSAVVTKLPEHDLGQAALNFLRQYGVDCGAVLRGGKRLGLYFLEQGASQRPSRVIYDRADSAFAAASAEDFDWKNLLKSAGWFHFSGITPALSPALLQSCLAACRTAKEYGIPVSCDLNFRKALWSREAFADAMDQLLPFVDHCIANEEDAVAILRFMGETVEQSVGDYEKQPEIAAAFWNRYSFQTLALTMRRTLSASDHQFQGAFYDGTHFYYSRLYSLRLVDRVGGGDSFSAGLLYALSHQYAPQDTVEFATAASCLKHSMEGDVNLASLAEVSSLMEGDGARVIR